MRLQNTHTTRANSMIFGLLVLVLLMETVQQTLADDTLDDSSASSLASPIFMADSPPDWVMETGPELTRTELESEERRIQQALEEGKFEDARKQAQALRARVENGPHSELIPGRSWSLVGRTAYEAGHYAEAIDAFQRAETAFLEAGDAGIPPLAETLSLRALSELDSGLIQPADAHAQRALKLLDQASPAHAERVVSAGLAATLVAIHLGEFHRGEQTLSRVESRLQAEIPHPNVLHVQQLVLEANIKTRTGDDEEVAACLDAAQAELDLLPVPHSPSRILFLEARGSFLLETRRYAEAQTTFQALDSLRRSWLPAGHPKQLDSRVRLFMAAALSGQLQTASVLHQGLEDQLIQSLGAQHPLLPDLHLAAMLYHLAQGAFAESERAGLRCIGLVRERFGDAHYLRADCENSLAQTYYYWGRYDEAEQAARRALELTRKLLAPAHRTTLQIQSNHASMLVMQGRLVEGAWELETCLAEVRRSLDPDNPVLIDVANNLAQIYRTQLRFLEAEMLVRESLDIALRMFGSHHPIVARLLQNIGQLYSDLGWYDRADERFQQALEIYAGDPSSAQVEVLTVYENLATSLLAQHRLEEAAVALDRGEVLLATLDRQDATAKWSYVWVRARVKFLSGRDAEAEVDFRQALEHLASEESSKITFLKVTSSYVTLLMKQKRYEEALSRLQIAQDALQKTLPMRHPSLIQLSLRMALIHDAMHHDDLAASLITRAVKLSLEDWSSSTAGQGLPVLWQTYQRTQLAMALHLSLSPAENASEVYATVLAIKGLILEQQMTRRVASHLDPETRLLFDTYQQSIRTYAPIQNERTPVGLGPPERAIWLMQRRARAEHAWSEVVKHERALAARSRAIVSAHTGGVGSVATLSQQLLPGEALIDYVVYHNEGLTGLTTAGPRQRLVAFVVQPDGTVTRRELGDWIPILEAIQALYESHATPRGQERVSAIRNQRVARVSSLIWQPLATELVGVKRVLISPDRELAMVPFGALPGANAGSRLLDTLEPVLIAAPRLLTLGRDREAVRVASAPSGRAVVASALDYDFARRSPARVETLASVLPRTSSTLRGAADSDRPIASSAAPTLAVPIASGAAETRRWLSLRGAAAEGKTVARLFRKYAPAVRLETLQGDQGTEDAFARQATGTQWLHAATHAFFDPGEETTGAVHDWLEPASLEHPRAIGSPPELRSGLILAGANQDSQPGGDDGILTAWELAALDLSATYLAVLATCSGAIGTGTGGEGLLSLQRALMVAGVRFSITSLWPVDDGATRVMMTHLYEALLHRRLGPVQALLDTQRWLRSQAGARQLRRVGALRLDSSGEVHPSLWAGWVISAGH